YFNKLNCAILDEYKIKVIHAKKNSLDAPKFPEHLLVPTLDNTWHDSAEAVINNWIGKVYQLTDIDRHKPFSVGVDPNNALNRK
ncbi:MAG: homoserine O-succinyltransferase, partial [Gammaproteobacteria bacterium]